MSRILPAGRLRRSQPRKSGSFRGNPRHVTEEVEEQTASGCDSAASTVSSTKRPRRRSRRVLRSNLEGEVPHHSADQSHCVRSSDQGGNSDVKGPMASLQGKHRLSRVGSVNVMDFGVDQEQRPLRDSILPDTSSRSGSMSHLVDKDGFLSWDNSHKKRSSHTSSHTSSFGSGLQMPILRRPGSCESALSNLSNLVDSTGFLGWDSRHCLDDDSQDLTPVCGGGYTNLAANKNAPLTNASWHIEDYEDANDTTEPELPSGSERTLTNRLRRLSLAAADGTAAVARGLARETGAGAPREAVRTADLKQLLLARRNGTTDELELTGLRRHTSVPTDDRPARRTSALRTLFGKKVDERSRRINRGDGVDIGELRRELQAGRSTGAAGKRPLSLSLF